MAVSWKRLTDLSMICLVGAIPWIILLGCSATDSAIRQSDSRTEVAVAFSYDNEQATTVCLAGDFNGWNEEAHCMIQEQGVWKLCIELPPGRHAFVFVVDGDRWVPDPTVLLRERDGFGGENSILIVE